ncbi:MAG: flagellar biosynthesis protein FliQ [Beijerinckiaceae bacterium]|nr:flagellar biosynthesis protein FliQ [Beijerinckiaceae bacterium]
MNGAEIMDIARDGILTFFKMGLPVMLIGLIVGVVISLLQALTQIQEQTLVYVPKIIVTFLALMLLMPFMSDALSGYMGRVATRIIAGG